MILRMPKLGMEMEEGTLAEWLVADGQAVAAGEPIFTVETEKVEHEVEAPEAGVLRHLVALGAVVPVGQPVAEVQVTAT